MSNPTNNPATIYATGAVSRNPATGELIATYPYQTPAGVKATLSANAAAFLLWCDMPMGAGRREYRDLTRWPLAAGGRPTLTGRGHTRHSRAQSWTSGFGRSGRPMAASINP